MRFSGVVYDGATSVQAGQRHAIVDLRGLNLRDQRIPVLFAGDRKIVGHTERVATRNGKVTVSGFVSGHGESVDEFRGLLANGFPWRATMLLHAPHFVEARPGSEVNGHRIKGEELIARRSVLRAVLVLTESDGDTLLRRL